MTTIGRPHGQSAYMEFSKLGSGAKYNLATSGVMSYQLGGLNVSLDQLEIHGPGMYGYPPLLTAIAEMKGVTPEWVVTAAGTSMANHLAMSALFAPGDEVLIEEPTYGLILDTALYLGAKVRRFQRRLEDNYALDADEVAKNLTPQTRLVVITNMHNPTSALASEESLRAVGELANEVSARVLVDEVYLEALHPSPVKSAIHLGEQFVTTSSLTKGYGLSGLRCGWILAEPGLAERMWQLNDLFSATPAHIAEQLSVIAIEQIEKLGCRADSLITANRNAFVEFPRLRQGKVDGFFEFLREKFETSVVPGKYFERPEHFRVGLAGDVEMTREGLTRLAAALHAWPGE
jgi:aspartate/methionine/tyrosine aminotransferase